MEFESLDQNRQFTPEQDFKLLEAVDTHNIKLSKNNWHSVKLTAQVRTPG